VTSPVVSLTAPAAGAIVSGTVSIVATATDAGGVTKVDFLVDGAVKGTSATAAYSYAWDTKTATNGTHTLTAKAYDASGNVGTSTARSVTVNNIAADTTRPTVSVTAPVSGSSAVLGTTVPVTVTAADNVFVSKVDIMVDGALKVSDMDIPYSYSWVTAGVSLGAHTITAKAYDTAGNTTTSSVVTVTIMSGTVATPGDCAGGTNGGTDGRVNALDLSALISHDNTSYPACDFTPNNGTSVLGAADMAVLLANWTW
jgi:hypothetical protein